MDGAFSGNINPIVDGEPVDANTTNRPLEVLLSNEEYLLNRLNAAGLNAGNVAYGCTCSTSVLVGQPVAWNIQTQQFEPAIAQAIPDPVTGFFEPGPLTSCLGICVNKENPTLCDIGLSGRIAVSIVNAVPGTPVGHMPPPGRYYLSGMTAGTLTQQRPPVAVPVLWWDGVQFVYISPTLHEFLESHVHLKVKLYAQPAGIPQIEGGLEVITSPNASIPGWLPAHHAVFNGQAPVGARFGYNLSAHPQLQNLWPPQPIASATLLWDKGRDQIGGTLVPQGPAGLVIFDANGIWWMTDCVGLTPWPTDWDDYSLSSSVGSIPGDVCPRPEEMILWLWFTEMLFATDKSVVTSVKAAAGSPIQITDLAGNPASVGDLLLALNLQFLVSPTLVSGGVAFKTLSGQTFQRGWVAEGVLAGSGIELSATQVTNIGTTENPINLYQGQITISAPTNLISWTLSPTDIRLIPGARERYLDTLGVMYLGFPQNLASGIRCLFDVPSGGLPPNAVLTIQAVIYGAVTGALPALTLTAKVIPDAGEKVPAALGTPVETAYTFSASGIAMTAAQYVRVSSAPIPVNAAATVFVSLSRAAADGYAGELGIIKIVAVLAQGS